ncbi:hypothetical protein ACFOYU_25915 [Microvirga sp. GCM10011540]|uniref:hypothetical protein n=1 Tax=Microvirga sp. GCM10011540 TaxID=3317338 RepID=UPI00360952AC
MSPTIEGVMYTFHKSAPAKSVMFLVTYTDGRTAYLWSEGHSKGVDDLRVSLIAKEQQDQGLIPAGAIASIKRVR